MAPANITDLIVVKDNKYNLTATETFSDTKGRSREKSDCCGVSSNF